MYPACIKSSQCIRNANSLFRRPLCVIEAPEDSFAYRDVYRGGQTTATRINDLGNGTLLEISLHEDFEGLNWGIESWQDGLIWRYYSRTFGDGLFARGMVRMAQKSRPIVRQATHSEPLLHLAVCRVVRASGTAKALDAVFYQVLDIVGPIAGEYTPWSQLPYFERCLVESLVASPIG